MVLRQLLSSIKSKAPILWSRHVGRMHWRNNITVVGRRVFYSTSGQTWDVADAADGVGCVDLVTGENQWFCPTGADANELAIFGNVLIVGTDGRQVFAIDTESGTVLSKVELTSPVYSKPISVAADDAFIVVLSSAGEVLRYQSTSHAFKKIGTIPFRFRANPVSLDPIHGERRFLAASETGEIISVEVNDDGLEYAVLFQVKSTQSKSYPELTLEVTSVSNLVVCQDRVLVSYARNTSDETPPLLCFSLSTGEKLWDASPVKTLSKSRERLQIGNSRVAPIVWRNQVLSTFSYDGYLHAFSIETGRWIWKLRLDEGFFQNWSSPVLYGDWLYVARVHGVLSKINLAKRQIAGSVSVEIMRKLETSESISKFSVDPDYWPNELSYLENSGPYPAQMLTAGICSTPTISEGKIVVGTVSGILCCVPS